MEKKLYISPLIEVAKVNMSTAVLTGSPTNDEWNMSSDPSHPGAPRHRTPVF